MFQILWFFITEYFIKMFLYSYSLLLKRYGVVCLNTIWAECGLKGGEINCNGAFTCDPWPPVSGPPRRLTFFADLPFSPDPPIYFSTSGIRVYFSHAKFSFCECPISETSIRHYHLDLGLKMLDSALLLIAKGPRRHLLRFMQNRFFQVRMKFKRLYNLSSSFFLVWTSEHWKSYSWKHNILIYKK